MKSKLPIIALLCAIVLATGACGKKPSFVDPPENNGGTAEQGTFPRPYPKPWL